MKPIITFFFACWMMDGSALAQSVGRHKNDSLSSLLARDRHDTMTGSHPELGTLYIPFNRKGLARCESSYRISLRLHYAYSIGDCGYLKGKHACASRDSFGHEEYSGHCQIDLISNKLQARARHH